MKNLYNNNLIEIFNRFIMIFFYVSRLSGLLNNYPPGSEEVVFNTSRPRHIKSHLTVELLPDQMWTSKAKVRIRHN